MTTKEYIEENQRRKEALFPPYNPSTGEGSPIPRFEIKLNTKTSLFLPTIIENLIPEKAKDNLPKYCEEINIPVEQMLIYIEQLRYMYDFEFYAYKIIKIKDKVSGGDVPFILNNPQRKVFKIIYDKIINNKPVRIDILKARKWGGSTLVNGLFNWIQAEVKTGWNSCIVTDVEEQARGIRAMTTKFSLNYPQEKGTFTLAPHEGSTKNKYIPERDCTISIGSMQKPDSLRSGTTYLVHLSEIGLWKSTLGKKPEDLIQTVLEMVSEDVPWTCIFRESTAKGVGTYFQKIWLQDKKGDSNYTPVFIPWYIEETNTKKVTDYDKLIKSFNEYDLFCWNEGATLEGINWYKSKLRNYAGDHWRMQSENPTTDVEAFQSTGSRTFRQEDVQKARRWNREPDFVGDIVSRTGLSRGKKCLTELEFVANPIGPLKIWLMPPTDNKIAHRFVVPMDIGGRWKGADWSVIRVLDRAEMIGGGVPEAILTYTNHIDMDLLAWKGAQIATAYQKALYVPESNSLDKEGTEGDHTLSILNEISKEYDNLYCRTSPEKIREGVPAMYGFHTNTKTKPALISNLNAAIREEDYIENDAEVCDEMDAYETKIDGTYGAVDGSHDDKLMCTAIGLEVSNQMPRPYKVEEKKIKREKAIKRTAAVI